jgi:hypothetical protein
MKSLQDAVDHHRDISEGEASYPQLLAALGSMNAEIAAARVLHVKSAMRDIWQTMNDLGITLRRLRSRVASASWPLAELILVEVWLRYE